MTKLEYQRAWVKKNHAKKLAYQAAYRRRNRAQLNKRKQDAEYARAYRAKNRAKLAAKSRAYRNANIEKWRAYNREYQRQNYQKRDRAKLTTTQRRWRDAHRVELNRKRRLAWARRVRDEIVIIETTTRMEVEQEMVLAQLEGRDPAEARRRWFANEKAWGRSTTPYVTPFEDGPYYQERRSA